MPLHYAQSFFPFFGRFFLNKYLEHQFTEGQRTMAGRKKIVDDNYEKILKEFSQQYFDNELAHGHELFSDAAWPTPDDAKYVQKATFLTNCRKAHMLLLKQMAVHISGLNNVSASAPDKNGEADKLLKQAMERLAPKEEEKQEEETDKKDE